MRLAYMNGYAGLKLTAEVAADRLGASDRSAVERLILEEPYIVDDEVDLLEPDAAMYSFTVSSGDDRLTYRYDDVTLPDWLLQLKERLLENASPDPT